MPLGSDTQYDLSLEEQDKIRRRLEIKARLKQEGVRRRYDPFLQMKQEIFSDPSIDRYMDFRKQGRLPNSPLKPSLFFGYLALLTIPFGIIHYVTFHTGRQERLAGYADGSIPHTERVGRHISPGYF